MSTLSTLPPSLRMTLRNLSRLGATVRSSISGSRMTISSYWCMTYPPPSDLAVADVLQQEGVVRRVVEAANAAHGQPQQSTRPAASFPTRGLARAPCCASVRSQGGAAG